MTDRTRTPDEQERSDDDDVEAHGGLAWGMSLAFDGRDPVELPPDVGPGEQSDPSDPTAAPRTPAGRQTNGKRT